MSLTSPNFYRSVMLHADFVYSEHYNAYGLEPYNM
jgi:hypothetical protein